MFVCGGREREGKRETLDEGERAGESQRGQKSGEGGGEGEGEKEKQKGASERRVERERERERVLRGIGRGICVGRRRGKREKRARQDPRRLRASPGVGGGGVRCVGPAFAFLSFTHWPLDARPSYARSRVPTPSKTVEPPPPPPLMGWGRPAPLAEPAWSPLWGWLGE